MTADHGGARDARQDGRRAGGSRGGGPRSGGPGAAAFAGVGLQLGFTLALFAWLGSWLDRRLGTSPWLLILLVFVGAAAGFYSIYRRVIGPGSGGGQTRREPRRSGPGSGPGA